MGDEVEDEGDEMKAVEWEVSTKNIRRGVVRSTVLEDPNEGVSILSIEATFTAEYSTLAVLFTPDGSFDPSSAACPSASSLTPLENWEGRL